MRKCNTLGKAAEFAEKSKKERSKERNKREYMYKRRKKKKRGSVAALLMRLVLFTAVSGDAHMLTGS